MTAMTDAMKRARDGQWLMVAGGVLLGTIGVFVEEAGQSPLMTVWFRCLFGGLALWLWGLYSGRLSELRLPRASWLAVFSAGALMLLNWALFFAAIPLISIGVSTVVFHIQPIWVMLIGAWLLGEAVSRAQWMATLVALCGLFLTTGILEQLGSIQWGAGYVTGLLLCLGGSLSYAAVTLIAKSDTRVGSFALAWWQCVVGVVVLAWAPFVYGLPQTASSWAWLVGLGSLHTGLAYVVVFAGMARLSLGRIALLQYVYPLTAVLVDWLVYGRTLAPLQLAGVALMALALWTIRKPKDTAPTAKVVAAPLPSARQSR